MNSSPRSTSRRDSTFLTTLPALPTAQLPTTQLPTTHEGGRVHGRMAQPLRVAVKDLINIAGTITTAGSAAVESIAKPAATDAVCLSGFRTAARQGRLRLTGKLNLHELAYGGDGINPHYGTPPNPLDPSRVPGGSSSASASAVGTDRADITLGSDTGGSIRIPAACCGVVGLKTTWGRVSLDGVWPLAPSLDTVGPLGATVDHVIAGMDFLEPGFAAEVERTAATTIVGRLRNTGVDTHPAVDAAIDTALKRAGFTIIDIDASWWQVAIEFGLTALIGEAHRSLGWLLDDPRLDARLEPRIANRIASGVRVSDVALAASLNHRRDVVDQIVVACRRAPVLVTPTLPILPPIMDEAAVYAPYTAYTRPANLSGTPALAIPVSLDPLQVSLKERHLLTSIQLMGPNNSEALLCSTGRIIEAADV